MLTILVTALNEEVKGVLRSGMLELACIGGFWRFWREKDIKMEESKFEEDGFQRYDDQLIHALVKVHSTLPKQKVEVTETREVKTTLEGR
jgi:hypothetical protein